MTKLQLTACAAAAGLLAFAVACYAPPAHAQERVYAYEDPRLIEHHDEGPQDETIIVYGYHPEPPLALSYEREEHTIPLLTIPPYQITEDPFGRGQTEVYTIAEAHFRNGASLGFANTRIRRPEGMSRGTPFQSASVWGITGSCPTPCTALWDWMDE